MFVSARIANAMRVAELELSSITIVNAPATNDAVTTD